MKKLLFFFTIFLFSVPILTKSQTLTFLYDESGNCIQKYLTIVMQQAPANPNQSSTELLPEPQMDEIDDVTISVYPNPTVGILNITISAPELLKGEFSELPYQLVLLDFSGKVLLTKQVQNIDNQLDVSSYPSGTYVLCIRFAGKQSTWKIIKSS